MGGGGGSLTAAEQDPNQAKKYLGGFYNFQGNQENKYVNQSPLLSRAETGASNFWDQIMGFLSPLQSAYGQYGDIIKSGGALSPQDARLSQQDTRTAASASGTSRDIGSAVNEVINQQSARERRLAGATSAASGLAGTIQGLQTGGLNQLLGVEGGEVSDFTTLQNPIMGFLSQILSGNQQARIANAQIGAQQSAQSKSGTSGAIGGALSAVGSIAGAAL